MGSDLDPYLQIIELKVALLRSAVLAVPMNRERLGKGRDGEIGAMNARGAKANMAFAKTFAIGDLSEGCDATMLEIFDPPPGLGDRGEQSIAGFGTHGGLRSGFVHDAFQGDEARSRPRQREVSRQFARIRLVTAGFRRFGRMARHQPDLHGLRPEATDFGQPTAAVTRWRVSALPSTPLPVPGVGRARWQLELIRCRAGESAEFEVDACDAKGRLALPSNLVHGSGRKEMISRLLGDDCPLSVRSYPRPRRPQF